MESSFQFHSWIEANSNRIFLLLPFPSFGSPKRHRMYRNCECSIRIIEIKDPFMNFVALGGMKVLLKPVDSFLSPLPYTRFIADERKSSPWMKRRDVVWWKFNFALNCVNSTIHSLFVINFSCACLPEEIVCALHCHIHRFSLPLKSFLLRLLFLSSCRCHTEVLCFAFDIYFFLYNIWIFDIFLNIPLNAS